MASANNKCGVHYWNVSLFFFFILWHFIFLKKHNYLFQIFEKHVYARDMHIAVSKTWNYIFNLYVYICIFNNVQIRINKDQIAKLSVKKPFLFTNHAYDCPMLSIDRCKYKIQRKHNKIFMKITLYVILLDNVFGLHFIFSKISNHG